MGKRFLWVAHGEDGLAFSSLDTFEDVWSQVFTGSSFGDEVGGFFIPSRALRDMFVFIGVTSSDMDDMDFLFEGEGVWMPLTSLHPEGLLKVLLMLWKCRDGKLVKVDPGRIEHRQTMGTVRTCADSLMVLPSALAKGGHLQDVFDAFLQQQWLDLGEYMELQSPISLNRSGHTFGPLEEKTIQPTVSDTLSWTSVIVDSDLRENCIGLALRQMSRMMSSIEHSGRRPSEWEPDSGKFVSLR